MTEHQIISENDIRRYMKDITGGIWWESTLEDGCIYSDIDYDSNDRIYKILEDNNILFFELFTPFKDRIYVKLEDAYNHKLRKDRDDRINEILK